MCDRCCTCSGNGLWEHGKNPSWDLISAMNTIYAETLAICIYNSHKPLLYTKITKNGDGKPSLDQVCNTLTPILLTLNISSFAYYFCDYDQVT